jgi:hypothetical protein
MKLTRPGISPLPISPVWVFQPVPPVVAMLRSIFTTGIVTFAVGWPVVLRPAGLRFDPKAIGRIAGTAAHMYTTGRIAAISRQTATITGQRVAAT